ncbi:hypothetical protein [Sporosarcina sp. FSL K6-1508]|uniref:hypothetical protein n=1 Tax=Sporosarcina sp. FSL K6-1508 TaxID=2921553 RepID=UPI0030F96C27
MLDITKRKMVTTRKEHECFGCLKTVDKGEVAVCITAKQDEQHMRFHLHLECNKTIAKRKIEMERGCVSEEEGFLSSEVTRWECWCCGMTHTGGARLCEVCGAEAERVGKERAE